MTMLTTSKKRKIETKLMARRAVANAIVEQVHYDTLDLTATDVIEIVEAMETECVGADINPQLKKQLGEIGAKSFAVDELITKIEELILRPLAAAPLATALPRK